MVEGSLAERLGRRKEKNSEAIFGKKLGSNLIVRKR